ncbi:ATP-dependent Clp protease adaptor ClpS [Bradyrhizobium elkanii]|uniref:ATP-dependent Clp protease adaptor ClpS n=1 Tax=Bradyrhizobium elkanii TaxID=29448 RepID=UPI00351659FF
MRLFIHDDDETPLEFVQDLLRTVFGKSEQEAIASAGLDRGQGRHSVRPLSGTGRAGNLQLGEVADPLQRPAIDDHHRIRRRQPPLRSLRSPEGCDGNSDPRYDCVAVQRLPARCTPQLGRIAGRDVSVRLRCARLAFRRRSAQPDRDTGATVSGPHARRRSGRDRQAAHRSNPFLRHP